MLHQNRRNRINRVIFKHIGFLVTRHFRMFESPTILFAGMREARRCRAGKRLVTHSSARPRVFALRLITSWLNPD
jgi:hypothetical protein